MTFSELSSLLPVLLMYTEMHYRFRLTGSRYFKNEPEILADAPFRISPGEVLPVMLLVKDADRYPVFLESVTIETFTADHSVEPEKHHIPLNVNISDRWWYRTIPVAIPDRGKTLFLMVSFKYKINDENRKCINHNLKLLSPEPMSVFISENPFPYSEYYRWGDIHFHSNLTDDMVEFGSPIYPTRETAVALGLDFFCVTDHSYDLDDKPGSWKETDPLLQKWDISRRYIQKLNEDEDQCLIIPGEEVTLMNHRRRNIHGLVLNEEKFIPGSGDGAERPFRFKSEYSTETISSQLSPESLFIAAHPFTEIPFFQWILIKRGKWEWNDIILSHITGLQILNGEPDKGFLRGCKIWVELLLKGYRKFIYAGNDSHGNFNMFRQIKTPMLSLHENRSQIFGKCRTGVISRGDDMNSIMNSLRKGRCIITNGPGIRLTCKTDDGVTGHPGDTLKASNVVVVVSCESTQEFGPLGSVTVYVGYIGEKEIVLAHRNQTTFDFREEFRLLVERPVYIRAVTKTALTHEHCIAMTNPIWVSPPEKVS